MLFFSPKLTVNHFHSLHSVETHFHQKSFYSTLNECNEQRPEKSGDFSWSITRDVKLLQVRLTFLQCVLKEPASQEANVEAAPTEHQLCPAHEPRPRSAHGANYTLLSGQQQEQKFFTLQIYESLIFKDHLYKRQMLFVIWSSLSFFYVPASNTGQTGFQASWPSQQKETKVHCYLFERRDIVNLPYKFPWKNVCTSWNTRFLLPLLLVTPKKLQKLEDALVEQILTGLAGLAHTVIADIF